MHRFPAGGLAEVVLIFRGKEGHDRERRLLLRMSRTGAAVGTKLVDFTVKRHQFTVELIERAQSKIAPR